MWSFGRPRQSTHGRGLDRGRKEQEEEEVPNLTEPNLFPTAAALVVQRVPLAEFVVTFVFIFFALFSFVTQVQSSFRIQRERERERPTGRDLKSRNLFWLSACERLRGPRFARDVVVVVVVSVRAAPLLISEFYPKAGKGPARRQRTIFQHPIRSQNFPTWSEVFFFGGGGGGAVYHGQRYITLRILGERTRDRQTDRHLSVSLSLYVYRCIETCWKNLGIVLHLQAKLDVEEVSNFS